MSLACRTLRFHIFLKCFLDYFTPCFIIRFDDVLIYLLPYANNNKLQILPGRDNIANPLEYLSSDAFSKMLEEADAIGIKTLNAYLTKTYAELSEQFGTNCLRCGRRLQPGFVMTDEPGIYFIPHLIDLWESQGMHKDFICYDKLAPFRDFGGVRLEDDLLITETGNRVLGEKIIPYHPKDVEDFIKD